MTDETKLGRLPEEQIDEVHTLDSPEKGFQAVLSKQDQIIDLLAALTAKIDADSGDTGGDNDYSDLTDALLKIKFRI